MIGGVERKEEINSPLDIYPSTRISSLEISHFRNISQLQFTPHPRFNFFFGENAQGKTSILEAIYYLSELKSFRINDSDILIQRNYEETCLKSEFEQNSLSYEVEIRFDKEKKNVLLNGKTPRPYRKLRQLVPQILFTPDSVRFFRNSPSSRRDYFDSLFSLISESFSELAQNYQRLLRQKQEFLDQIFSYPRENFKNELGVWNEKLAHLGAELAWQRKKYTQELAPFFARNFEKISHQAWKGQLFYKTYFEKLESSNSKIDWVEYLLAEMERRGEEERARSQVLVGPHRDDWNLQLGEGLLKEEGSQGQHRLAVAALKLSEVEFLQAQQLFPIALFDDLLSELDGLRVQTLLETLRDFQCQVFLTSIHWGSLPKGFEGQFFEVKKGQIFTV